METTLIQLVKDDFRNEFNFYNENHKERFEENCDKIRVLSYDKFLDENVVRGKLNGALENMQSSELNLNILPVDKRGFGALENSIDKTKEMRESLKMKNRYNLFSKDYWDVRKISNEEEVVAGKGQVAIDLIGIGGTGLTFINPLCSILLVGRVV